MTYLAPTLVAQGYVGVTGSNPYQASTATQVATLQQQYTQVLPGQTLTPVSELT